MVQVGECRQVVSEVPVQATNSRSSPVQRRRPLIVAVREARIFRQVHIPENYVLLVIFALPQGEGRGHESGGVKGRRWRGGWPGRLGMEACRGDSACGTFRRQNGGCAAGDVTAASDECSAAKNSHQNEKPRSPDHLSLSPCATRF